MLIKIHDLPVKYPMQGISFHVTKDAVDRVWWDGKILELVTVKGEVWHLDFDEHSWVLMETIWVDPSATEEGGSDD